MNELPGMEDSTAQGVTLRDDIGRITFVGLPNRPGIAAAVLERIARRRIVVDDIIQNVTNRGQAVSFSFTVDGGDVPAAQAVAELLAQQFTDVAIEIDFQLSRLSVVGVGMGSHGGVAARMFKALADENINIENISTSEDVISVLVRREDAERAVHAVHQAFGLGKPA
jgi:aspartate kinase